ncbi:hypothetical protein KFE25_003407 [Diacronema lutheri]|uniref:Uncharacterized protein n=2 Tax=Diacronema lutheri TaxID=2081491 RepID=A0A8J5XPI6_DIALT|nr:hypothetical protein KFE25_003407 [Diacronema lutheri]
MGADGGTTDGKMTSGPTLSRLVAIQAAIQAALRPASRVPLFRSPHGWCETWRVEGCSSSAFLSGLEQGLEELNASPRANGFVYTLDKGSASHAHGAASARVRILTKLRWLDLAELYMKDSMAGLSLTCTIRYFSTGLLPLTVPGAPLINTFLFFAPFSHCGLPEHTTLPAIRSAVALPKVSITVLHRGFPL